MSPCSIALAAAMCAALPLACASGPGRPGWRLVWHDEFDGPALDTTKWVRETGGDGWGNAELQFYTNDRENARLESGHLVVTARREQAGGREYTSARLKTEGLGSW